MLFFCKAIFRAADRYPKELGIDPSSLFAFKAINNTFSNPTVDGIVDENELVLRLNVTKLLSKPTVLGSVPWYLLLCN